jgi:threonine-phosphate decarboxylase
MDLKDDFPCEPASQPGRKPEEVRDFSIPVNPLGPSKRAERKMVKNLSAALRFSEAPDRDLSETLARFHGLSAEEILLGAGATEFVRFLPRALLVRRALMVTPISGKYEKALEAIGHDLQTQIDYFEAQEEDGFEVDVNGLISSLTHGYDALYLSNPGFPTGILTAKKDLDRVLAQTERHRTWFVLDETAIDFAEEDSLKDRVKTSSRLLILRSFSNFFAIPGLRVGYLLGNREAIQKIRDPFPSRTVNALGQLAAAESLRDQAYIRRTREWVPKEMGRFAQSLRSIPGFVPYPAAADFILVQLLPFLGVDGGLLGEELLKQGVRIGDCGAHRLLASYFIFIALRSRRENNLLIKTLRKVTGDLPARRSAAANTG